MLNQFVIVMTAITLVGCAGITIPSISATTESLLVQPISCCERAASDIAALENAKPSTLDQIGTVFRSLAPVGIVSGLVMSDYGKRWDIISGELSDKIDVRIAEMKKTCPDAKPMQDEK